MAIARRTSAVVILGVNVALTAACSTAPPKSPEQERADAATTERIEAAFEANPIYYLKDVDVSVDNGVAHLSGYVWTTTALYSAELIARRVPGVTQVRSQVELERQGNRGGADTGGQ